MISRSTPNQIAGIAAWLVLSFSAAAVGAVASVRAADFYEHLVRPEWAPPSWLFGPVWTFLYLLIGVAAWRIWRERGFRGAGAALGLFIVQLAANSLWTWLFFAWHKGLWAFVEIVVLWILILATTISFWRVRAVAGGLRLPYLAWVTFAAALCFVTWQLNPGALGN